MKDIDKLKSIKRNFEEKNKAFTSKWTHTLVHDALHRKLYILKSKLNSGLASSYEFLLKYQQPSCCHGKSRFDDEYSWWYQVLLNEEIMLSVTAYMYIVSTMWDILKMIVQYNFSIFCIKSLHLKLLLRYFSLREEIPYCFSFFYFLFQQFVFWQDLLPFLLELTGPKGIIDKPLPGVLSDDPVNDFTIL